MTIYIAVIDLLPSPTILPPSKSNHSNLDTSVLHLLYGLVLSTIDVNFQMSYMWSSKFKVEDYSQKKKEKTNQETASGTRYET